MEKIKARLNQLTRLVLSGTLDEEQRREVNAQLATLRNLIATWRAYEGYDGEIDPDASSTMRPNRNVHQMRNGTND